MNSRVPSRTPCSLLETVPACPLPKKDWATLLHTCHHHRYLLVTKHFATKHLVTTISVPAEITLLKSACHFLLLLVGIDILTYRKDYNWTPCTCGSSRVFSGAVAGEPSALGKWKLVRENYFVC